MRKRDRHQLIKKNDYWGEIKKKFKIGLRRNNVFVTQTTLSRDLREIGLTKVMKNDMVYYVPANEQKRSIWWNFVSSFRSVRWVYLALHTAGRSPFWQHCGCKQGWMDLEQAGANIYWSFVGIITLPNSWKTVCQIWWKISKVSELLSRLIFDRRETDTVTESYHPACNSMWILKAISRCFFCSFGWVIFMNYFMRMSMPDSEISLTSRNKNADTSQWLVFLYHSAQQYIDVLIEKKVLLLNIRIPKQAAGVVKREAVQPLRQGQWSSSGKPIVRINLVARPCQSLLSYMDLVTALYVTGLDFSRWLVNVIKARSGAGYTYSGRRTNLSMSDESVLLYEKKALEDLHLLIQWLHL